jgi:hypothetical protein
MTGLHSTPGGRGPGSRPLDDAELSGEPGAEQAVGGDPGQVDSPMTLT